MGSLLLLEALHVPGLAAGLLAAAAVADFIILISFAAEELQEVFRKNGLEMTIEEVVDLCGKIARQMEAGENGEISEDALEDVTGGIAWALIGLGVLCVGAVALGIYNGYQETKRKK